MISFASSCVERTISAVGACLATTVVAAVLTSDDGGLSGKRFPVRCPCGPVRCPPPALDR
jgi:hypothetical protein